MSRPLRIEYPCAWYHVMNRGRRGESVFRKKEDDLAFIEALKVTVDMWNPRVGAYCLMPSHYHLAIYLLRSLRGDNLEEFGREFNITRFSSVSSVVERMRGKISGNRQLKTRAEEIKTAIYMSQA
jgi:hypothetical protein